jgi:outer membrane protein assembly factor BamA
MMRRPLAPTAHRTAWLCISALVAACACSANVSAQETRADLLEQERAPAAQESEAALPAAPSWLERTFSWGEAKLQDASWSQDGLYPELGGMIPGSGFSVGPGYRHRLFGDLAIVDASAAVSWNQYTMLRSRLEWPQLFTNRLSVGTELKYQDFTQINFFGIGAASLMTNQTNYRLQDVDALGFATLRPNRWLSIGGRVGVITSLGIAAGTSSLSPPTGERFDEISAPGLTRQPDFLHADVSLDVDTEDVPGYPTSGGRYHLGMATFQDRSYSQYSFERVDAEAAEYIPLLHKSWVLALRGRAVLTETAAGQEVPFYLLPTLGGSTTLRGFLDDRFRDRDLLLFNAEYRWPLFRALDGALFYDAGTVAPSAQALSVPNAHTDYGIGVRLHSTTRTIVRLDVGRSVEGYRAFLTFKPALKAPSRTVAPYAP